MNTNTNILSSEKIAELKKAARRDILAINKGEASSENLSLSMMSVLRQLMEGLGIANKELVALDDSTRKQVAECWDKARSAIFQAALPPHKKGEPKSKARGLEETTASRIKAMAHRGVCPGITTLAVPVLVVEHGDGDDVQVKEGTRNITIDRISDWNQASTEKGTGKDKSFIAGASTIFQEKKGDATGYDLDTGSARAKRIVSDRAATAFKGSKYAMLSHSDDDASKDKEKDDAPWQGVPIALVGTKSCSDELDKLITALGAVPKGDARQQALKLVKECKVAVEMLAHAAASKDEPTLAEKEAVTVPF